MLVLLDFIGCWPNNRCFLIFHLSLVICQCLDVLIHSNLTLRLGDWINSSPLILISQIVNLLKKGLLWLWFHVVLLRIIIPWPWDLFQLNKYLFNFSFLSESLDPTFESAASIALNFYNDCALVHVGLYTWITHVLLDLVLSRTWVDLLFGQFGLSFASREERCISCFWQWFRLVVYSRS